MHTFWEICIHQVLSVTVQTQNDNSNMASICIPTEEEARTVIKRFHNQKMGYKRIQVSLYQPEHPYNALRMRLVWN